MSINREGLKISAKNVLDDLVEDADQAITPAERLFLSIAPEGVLELLSELAKAENALKMAWATGYHSGIMDEFKGQAETTQNPYA